MALFLFEPFEFMVPFIRYEARFTDRAFKSPSEAFNLNVKTHQEI